MLFQNFRSKIQGKLFLLLVPALAVGSFPWGGEAEALEFGSGEVEASLDTTVSYGATFRVADRDPELAADVNGNDGDLNYKTGIVSNAFKFTSEFDLGYGDFGLFVRGSGFFDFENESGTRERTPLSAKAKRMVGKDIELLDAYATGTFDLGEVTADLRAGKHVLNWGESTFIQGGVNAINPFDVSKLRVPGAELREALVAVPLVSTVLEFPVGLSMEGFYQLAWDKTEIDPVGSYFSVTDYVGPGASRAVVPLPGSNISDEGFGFGDPLTRVINADLTRVGVCRQDRVGCQPAFDANFVNVFRGADRNPADSGQFGVALRYLAEQLNETEFGFYFVNYHSRLPTVSAITGTGAGVQAGLAAAGAVGSPTSNTTQAVAPAVTQAVTPAVTAKVTAEVQAEVQAGSISPADAPTRIANKVRAEVGEHVSAEVGRIAGALSVDRYGKTASYFIEYPEDIQLFGLSFNTGLGTTGWALQGEYSFRKDQPLQRAERALFAEGLAPVLRLLDDERTDYIPAAGVPAYLAAYQPAKVQGYIKRNVSQTQATATRVFGPTLGADSLIFLTEVAVMHVHDMPKQADTPIESPAAGSDADATSWGYRIASRLDYNNAIGAVNLFPYLQFQHDVSGDSPSPSGSFVQGRTALTVGVRASYLTSWEANLGYTSFSGRRNELRDRDFVAATVKYSF